MAYYVVWQMGDGKVTGPKQEREWGRHVDAMRHYDKLVLDTLTEWVSVVNRTNKGGERMLVKWDYRHGETKPDTTPPLDDTEIL